MVVPSPIEIMQKDLDARHIDVEVPKTYRSLYAEDATGRMFARFHFQADQLLEYLDYKSRTDARHYNADESRQLIQLMDEIRTAHKLMGAQGQAFEIASDYTAVFRRCNEFLQMTQGSSIPADLPPMILSRYQPVFRLADRPGSLQVTRREDLRVIGTGSYGTVWEFLDPNYGVKFAVKRVRSDGDLVRFRREYELMREMDSPNVLRVFNYDERLNEYTMEHCSGNLRDFIRRNNAALSFGQRRDIAAQFLRGLQHIHQREVLHRDLSAGNILVQEYDDLAVTVKIADFGLAKALDSELTRTHSEVRGTIVDPALESFANYDVSYEMYPVGYLLGFIFSGRNDPHRAPREVLPVIRRCIDTDRSRRYSAVAELAGDVGALLEVEPGQDRPAAQTHRARIVRR